MGEREGEQEGLPKNIPWWQRRRREVAHAAVVLLVVFVGLFVWSQVWHGSDMDDAVATARAGILAVIAATFAADGATLALFETRRAKLEAQPVQPDEAKETMTPHQRRNRGWGEMRGRSFSRCGVADRDGMACCWRLWLGPSPVPGRSAW